MIPFTKPYASANELAYISKAIENGILSGDGPFTKKCHAWLEGNTGTKKALLTHSCTAALEMAAILIDTQAGDEIIMPSYTFVSTANAFVLRGGVPVFVDIREDTFNIDERLIEAAITDKTKAIVVVHYAGVACEMDVIMSIAKKYNLFVIEDAAQAIGAKYHDKPLGSIGHLGALSFHATKNIVCGEGGALLINDPQFIERAEIVREKGTNRAQFFRGMVDKYRWVDIGSSYLPSELNAAFLYAQFESVDYITESRRKIWQSYHNKLAVLEEKGICKRAKIPEHCLHNGHLYALIFRDMAKRDLMISALKENGIGSVFHYFPLHQASAAKAYAKEGGSLLVTEKVADTLLRLPLWAGLTEENIAYICKVIIEYVS